MLSTRDKPDNEYCKKIFKVLKAHEVHYFFYIGGNDSSDTCRIVNEQARAEGYELRVIHIPKTIDNDLVVTDHCPGYGSAAKYVAMAFTGGNVDNRAIPGVYIAVVMGRNAGFLTAASVFARKYPDDGPHLIYVPETAFTVEKFLADVDAVMKKHNRCVIAVSEGIKDADGQPIMVKLTQDMSTDAHGNVQLSGTGALGDLLAERVKKDLKMKRVRADTLGYMQRSFPGVISEVDSQEAREVGEKAAQFACWHQVDGSVAIRRTGDYSVEYFLTPLESVAAKTFTMPQSFLCGNNDVSEEFKNYARPLLGPMPNVERVAAPKVAKILNA
jgi:6-phosphofructokinase 1